VIFLGDFSFVRIFLKNYRVTMTTTLELHFRKIQWFCQQGEGFCMHVFSSTWELLTMLRSKSTAPTYVPMDLDIWRYIIHGKGTESNHKWFWLYAIEDMCRMQLPEYWWYTLNLHGEGEAIMPPFKIKPILSWTPYHQIIRDGLLTQAPKMPIEKLCIDSVRRPCNVNNL
jgi:hypothetical protein